VARLAEEEVGDLGLRQRKRLTTRGCTGVGFSDGCREMVVQPWLEELGGGA